MFNKRQTIIIILKNLAKSVVAILIALFVVYFSYNKIAKISASLREQWTAAYLLESRSEIISRLQDGFKTIGLADKKINDAFPSVNNILGFVDALESLAIRTSVKQTPNFSAPSVDSGYIDYNLNLGTSVYSLINYLKEFEKLPYFTMISGFNLSALNGWENESAVVAKGRLYVKE